MRIIDIYQFFYQRFKLVFICFVCGLFFVLYLTTRNILGNTKTSSIYSSVSVNGIKSTKTYLKNSVDINAHLKSLTTDAVKIVEVLHPFRVIHKKSSSYQPSIKVDKNIVKSSQNISEEVAQVSLPLNTDIQKGIERLLNTPEKCGPGTTVIIVVCSAANHHQKRQTIRETWGSIVSTDLRIVFLVGTVPPLPAASTSSLLVNHTKLDAPSSAISIDEEANRFRDVIRADFIDSYANLTIKSLAMLKWVSTYCSAIRFLLKCDDDVIINTPLLLRDLRDNAHRRFVMGNVIAYARPVRQSDAKWYIPHSVYNQSTYPTYASGAAYVISGDIVSELYRAGLSSRTPLFRIEDVFVTGFLTRSIDAQLIYNGKFDGYKVFVDPCTIHRHIVRHKLSEEETRFLWSVISKSPEECRNIYKSVFSKAR